MPEEMQWKVHTPRLLEEVLENPQCAIMHIPINIFANLLHEVGERAVELDDPQLNALMLRLTLYEAADPYLPNHDAVAVAAYIKEHSPELAASMRDQ